VRSGLLNPAERLDLLIAARVAVSDATLARLSSAMPALIEGTGSRGRRATGADRDWTVARLG
jgi:hypothetical protein